MENKGIIQEKQGHYNIYPSCIPKKPETPAKKDSVVEDDDGVEIDLEEENKQ